MPKFKVYAVACATWPVGEYEAETKEEAETLAWNDGEAEMFKGLCHQCADEVELNDAQELIVEEVT